MPEKNTIDKQQMRRSFEKAAAGYDDAAFLQQEIGDRVVERLDYIRFEPRRVLDVGAGTGFCTRRLAKRYPKADIIALDIAHQMLLTAKQRESMWDKLRGRYQYITADAEQLPLADAGVDMIFSNLAVQWCLDLEQLFREFRRVLAPGGMLMFTTFGPDTLKELRASWAQVDKAGHVNEFEDMHNIGDLLLQTRFAEPIMDMEYMTVTYQDVFRLMKDLKMLGAHNVTTDRQRQLTGKAHLQKMIQHYESFRTDGVLPATYEIVYGHAWAPVGQMTTTAEQSLQASIPLQSIQPIKPKQN
ncbi:MAG: malonyl-ACP O-methyltransferase BioC [Gammaproteobacteria bacterium]|nr:malonyl-ACP O-methyltransferase BioC [Gammaproteobacteria bacterium]MDH5653227.1 malonyl-ACP O-methyltransferase BioC [Gammaproteobacteria bacterium]